MSQPQTDVEDAAIVLAWAGEFRSACLSAAAGTVDPVASAVIQRLRFLLGAPASAALAAQQRIEARETRTQIPPLALVHDTERPS